MINVRSLTQRAYDLHSNTFKVHKLGVKLKYVFNVLVHSVVLVEGELMKKTRMNLRRNWESRWCILCKDMSAGGDAILRYYNHHPDEPKSKMKGMINITTNVNAIQIFADSETNELSANNRIPGNIDVVKKEESDSDKLYSFIMQTEGRDFVFSGINRESFLQWIWALHFVVSCERPSSMISEYMNPMEVATIFREFQLAKDFESFFVENYCDSLRVQQIPIDVFRTVYARVMGQENNCLAAGILKHLQHRVLPLGLGWDGVVNAIRHEIDPQLSRLIEQIRESLPEINDNAGVLLAENIETKTQRNLTNAEKEYLNAMILRFIEMSDDLWMPCSAS